MGCDQIVERYTDYRDGLLEEAERRQVEEHLSRCACCARYDRVMRRGLEILADMPCAEASDDFMPRLRYRLYSMDCGAATARGRFGGSAALVGVAAVGLLALFWLPFASRVPLEMELPAVSALPPTATEVEIPSLFRTGPFVSTLLIEEDVNPGGDLQEYEWPPRLRAQPIVAIEAPYLRAESEFFDR